MYIAVIINNVDNALGPNNRLCIWTQGCLKNCKNCMSPEFRTFNSNKNIDIIKELEKYDFTTIEGVTISGGEPFLQLDELELLVEYLSKKVEDILIYTGMKYNTLKLIKKAKNIFSKIAVLIDGEYKDELNNNEILRGSSNQNIIILNEKFKDLYEEYSKRPRAKQIVKVDTITYGIGLREKGE